METIRTTTISAAFCMSLFISAQSPCDQLEILSLQHGSFSDTTLELVVQNNGEFINYPLFLLMNGSGDTLALEQMSFFGIGSGSGSLHVLNKLPGASFSSPFNGILELTYIAQGGLNSCTLPISLNWLCPQDCADVRSFVYGNAQTPVNATFVWNITNAQDAVVAEGSWELQANAVQEDWDDLCLVPGSYTLHVEQPLAGGESFGVGITASSLQFTSPVEMLLPGSAIQMPFMLYPSCFDIDMVLREQEPTAPFLHVTDNILFIRSEGGATLGDMALFSINGSLVKELSTMSNQGEFPLGGLSSGVYVLAPKDRSIWPAQKVVIE